MRVRRLLPFAALAATLFPVRAHADADVDLRSFRPSTDRRGSLATEGVETPGAWNLQLASWFVFESTSLRVNTPNGETRTVVGPRLIVEPTVALGLGRRAAIGIALPFVPIQDGGTTSLTDGRPLASQSIGDVALTGKASVIEPDPSAGGLGFAFLTRFQFPTGDRASFASDSKTIAEGRALVVFDYNHTLIGAATAGYRARFASHDVTDVTLGDSIPWGATLSLRPRALGLDDKGHWTWSLEAHGEVGAVPMKLFETSRVSPAFLGASARYEIDNNFSLFAGVELGVTQAIGSPLARGVFALTYAPTIVDDDHDGVPDDVDECPGLPEDGRGAHPRDGCPDYEGEQTNDVAPIPPPIEAPTSDVPPPAVGPADADGDGIPDDVDKCPNEPETKNGYEDDDGCPELDKDGDTFLDAVDKCPDQPETFNGYQDDDGCPDEAPAPKKGPKPGPLAKQENGAIVLAKPIAFEGAEPKDAQSELRAVAAFLLANPGAKVVVTVRPEGKGEQAQKVAADRAAAIVTALVRFAHTGGVAEAGPSDVKGDAKAKSSVTFTLVKPPAKSP